MAGWDNAGINNDDDDVLNLNLFARKSFGFHGIPKEKEDILKKIVTHIGASCDDYPKYIFTSVEHYKSLIDVNSPSNALYNVTYIRDCVDANRCLTIEHYKFGPKYSEKKEYREFEPCCANFHNSNKACLVCDPTFKADEPKLLKVTTTTTKRRTKTKSTLTSEAVESTPSKVKKENTVQNSSEANSMPHRGTDDSNLDPSRQKLPWEPWEERMIIDYLICNKLISFSKGPSVYRRIIADGYLKHRTPESMRIHFRIKVLKKIEQYNLPPAVVKEFKKIRKVKYPARVLTKQKLHIKGTQYNKKRGA